MSIFVDARNLTNTRYITDLSTITNANTASTVIFYPGDGTSAFAGLRVRL